MRHTLTKTHVNTNTITHSDETRSDLGKAAHQATVYSGPGVFLTDTSVSSQKRIQSHDTITDMYTSIVRIKSDLVIRWKTLGS